MISADVHNHTRASHGEASVAEMYAAARAKGLTWFGISEHSVLPVGFFCRLYQEHMKRDFPLCMDEVTALRAENTTAPHMLLGMELDWLPSNMAYMQNLFEHWSFDYIIGGLHYMMGMFSVGAPQNWNQGESEEDQFARFEMYYAEMANMASSGLINIVAHPDFIKIRTFPIFQKWLQKYGTLDVIAKAVTAMRDNNVAMEVSSAGLRQPFAEPYPAPAIMRLAADIGVNISFGSDAHNVEDVAQGFDILTSYAHSFGFTQHIVFQERKAFFLEF